MDTLELTQALSQNKHTKKYFIGVYPSNLLPKIRRRPVLFIANTDPADKPGTHWVAFYIPKAGPIEFFDSIANTPVERIFVKYMLKNAKSYRFSDKRLQGLFTTTCGKYCAVYLYYKSRGMSFVKFQKMFGINLSQNEDKINRMYNRIFVKNQIGGSSRKINVIINQTCKPCE